MEFQDVLRTRKMVRSFEDRPIPPEIVERIIRNARRGPSAGFSQGVEFLVLDGREQTGQYWDLEQLNQAPETAPQWPSIRNAPLIIAFLSDKAAYIARYSRPDKEWTNMADESLWPVPFWDIDAGMAAMLVLLTAVDAGLGACFVGVVDQAEFKSRFGIPERMNVVGCTLIGYPETNDVPSPSLARGRRPATEVVHRGKWG
ncbi:MAG: nitroreductase family protein [Dehalococcoidia bacterium]